MPYSNPHETGTPAEQGSISFEKKKQKTFAYLVRASSMGRKRIKVWFIFSKKNCSPGAWLPLAAGRSQRGLELGSPIFIVCSENTTMRQNEPRFTTSLKRARQSHDECFGKIFGNA
jgi:hypothetical protein